jgi:transposase
MIGLDPVVGVLLGSMPRRWEELLQHGRVRRSPVGDNLDRHHLRRTNRPLEEPASGRRIPPHGEEHVDDLAELIDRSVDILVELFGVGPVLAATFLGEVGDVRRFPTKHHFAAHTGTAPLEASSGQIIRHRLSRAGDRKLNHALYMMAMVQVRRPSAGQAYYQRKLAEGKSPKDALRCLKRRLSNAVYRCLVNDQVDQRLAVAAN